MTDEEDEAYKRGERDTKITTLERDVSWLKKVVYVVVGAVMASWAKVMGLLS